MKNNSYCLVAALVLLGTVSGFSNDIVCIHRTAPLVPSAQPLTGSTSLFDTTIYNTKRAPYSASIVLHAKKQINKDSDDVEENNTNILGIFKKSPGTAIIAPFVILFGLDLILNILVVTKRSLEVAFTGEYTVWTPWVQDFLM